MTSMTMQQQYRETLASAVLPHDAFWAIEPGIGQRLWGELQRMDLAAHRLAWQQQRQIALAAVPVVPVAYVGQEESPGSGSDRPRRKPYRMEGSVAVLEIVGPMTKQETSWDEGTSTVRVRRQVRQAAADPDVTAMALVIDSPGGQVAGTYDLAEDVRRAAQQKPLYAYVEDLGASAAYWVASQANAIYANPSALVGSIGVYMTLIDMSKMAESLGVRVEVLRDGAYKGAGEPGTPITDEVRAYYQGIVNEFGAQFRSAIARGRGMGAEQVASVADGRVHIAAKARGMGLVDGVTSLDNMLAKLKSYRPA